MIKLSDVSISKLYSKILNIQKSQKLPDDINDCIKVMTIFRENGISDYQELKNMLYKFEDTFLYYYIKSDIDRVEKRIDVANKKGIDLKKQQDTAKPQVPQDDQETNVFSASSFAQSKEDSLHASVHLSNTSSVKERLDQAKKLMLNTPSVSSDDSMVTSQSTAIPTTIFKKN